MKPTRAGSDSPACLRIFNSTNYFRCPTSGGSRLNTYLCRCTMLYAALCQLLYAMCQLLYALYQQLYALFCSAIYRSTVHESATVVVVGLNIFPVKSCKAVKVQEIQLDRYGVVGDRRFMVAESGGRFVSQRKCPKLATVTATYVQAEGTQKLQLSSPDMDKVLKIVPKSDGPRTRCSLWTNPVDVIDQGDEAAGWLSTLLEAPERSYRLVACAESAETAAKSVYKELFEKLPSSLQDKLLQFPMVTSSTTVALADCAPASLVSQESLAALNEKLKAHTGNTVTLNRFRMNIEIAGCNKPYAEDEWLLIKIGSASFLVYNNAEVSCFNCSVPCYRILLCFSGAK